jgi:type III restriction enzyme
MELKTYQRTVINDLGLYIDTLQEEKKLPEAFIKYWKEHPRNAFVPKHGEAVEPYKDNINRVPTVCVKVPTAGGKTFIACNALEVIFKKIRSDSPRIVVWLVPSVTILEQTVRNLRNPSHPYRMRLNLHFNSRVEVYEKDDLLGGRNFNAATVSEQTSILVMSFDSLRAKKKEDRKLFQQNSDMLSFTESQNDNKYLLEGIDDTAVINVIRSLNPVLVVDESHNAETELSIEMLKNLNPCFILDLTATPRKNSNIISFVDALELKRENMVKLPIIVHNQHERKEVILNAIQLQKKLELKAIAEEKAGGNYIRPIVLFQAQAKTQEGESITFEKVKKLLIDKYKIPTDHIKIKTANINEIKNEDLMSRDCQVRYIITINALKEGWDCPFAYILASLADRSSVVDIEQLVGRVLRQPYVKQHQSPMLNMSYVLTASAKFQDTLKVIIKGLNRAGFSEKTDLISIQDDTPKFNVGFAPTLDFSIPESPKIEPKQDDFEDLENVDSEEIAYKIEEDSFSPNLEEIEVEALKQDEALKLKLEKIKQNPTANIASELANSMPRHTIKKVFQEKAASINIPQFFVKFEDNLQISINFDFPKEKALQKEDLIAGFRLSTCSTDIQFGNLESNLFRIDLDADSKDHIPTILKIDGRNKQQLLEYIVSPAGRDQQVKNVVKWILQELDNDNSISQGELQKFVNRIVQDLSEEQLQEFAEHEYSNIKKIKDKIRQHKDEYAAKKFSEFLDTDKIFMKENYTFAKEITPKATASPIAKSLYEKEGELNGFEERVIMEVSALENIAFWTRNPEYKGFCINGFINHYPDFIIVTKPKDSQPSKIIVLETKGDDRDNSDTKHKIRLGEAWEKRTRSEIYKYFMVFDKQSMDGAKTLEEFLNILRKL